MAIRRTHPPRSRVHVAQQGWREIGGRRIYFRSKWEANYARYLELLKIKKVILDWQFEPLTFWFEGIKRGTNSYKPDFQVTTIGGGVEYHEVKGYMDPKSATKLKRMAKYYPDVKMILVDRAYYQTIARQISAITLGWER